MRRLLAAVVVVVTTAAFTVFVPGEGYRWELRDSGDVLASGSGHADATAADAAAADVLGSDWPGTPADGTWHLVGDTDEPAFENSWGNDSGYMRMAFRIREAGVLDIYGKSVGGGGNQPIFTLPVGYRPSGKVSLAISPGGGLIVDTDGTVTPTLADGATKPEIAVQVFLDVPPDAP